MGTKQELLTNLNDAIALGKTNLAAGGVDTTDIHSVYGVVKAIPDMELPAAKGLISIAVTTPPTTTTFAKGGVFSSSGMVVTAYYADKTTADVTASVTVSAPDMNTVGMQSVTVTYEDKTDIFDITIKDYTISSIAVTTPPTKTVYKIGDSLIDTSGMVVTAFQADGISYAINNYALSSIDTSTAGTKTITVTASGKTTTFNLVVEETQLELPFIYSTTEPELNYNKLWVETTPLNEYNGITIGYDPAKNMNVIEQLTTLLPTGVVNAACGVVGTKCYIFGGRQGAVSSGTNFLNTIYAYDTTTGAIETLNATLPVAADHIACGVVGTKCYLFGGRTDTLDHRLNTINIFDTETKTLTTLETPTLNRNIAGIACGTVNTKIYLFGGDYSSSSNEYKIYEFDTTNNSLNEMGATLEYGITRAGCVAIGTKCYIIGGFRSTYYGSQNTIKIYDTENDSLITETNVQLPSGIQETSCGVLNSKCYIFGRSLMGSGDSTGKIAIYDPQAHTIEQTRKESSSFPSFFYGATCGVINNIAYIFGGYVDNPLNTIYKCVPTEPFSLSSGDLYIQTGDIRGTGITNVHLIQRKTEWLYTNIFAVYRGNENSKAQLCNVYKVDNNAWTLAY